ncbi:hypothetical protein [Persephonella sp.]
MEKILSLFDTYPLEYKLGEFFVPFTAGVLILLLVITTFNALKKIKTLKPKFPKKEKVRIDPSNTKETAYTLTYLIRRYDTPYNKQLLKRLEKFKYRKEVESFDRETLELISKFMEYMRRNYGGI